MPPMLLAMVLATQVIRYAPPARLPAKTESGHCWTGSIAAPYRQDAFRCMVGNEIHDPCFATPQKDRVLCGMNPATGEAGFVLKLTKPLPAPEAPPTANEKWAWLIELPDGAACFPFTGTNPMIKGKVAHYGCGKDESELLLGDLVSKGQTWTAQKATVQYDASGVTVKSQSLVVLKRVWQ
jgi:hypothetical protein